MLEPPLPPYKELYSFAGGTDGASPFGLVSLNGTLYGMTEFGGASNVGTVFSVTPAGTEHVLYSFKGGNDGEYPFLESLVAVNGILYVGGRDRKMPGQRRRNLRHRLLRDDIGQRERLV
jgi:uncharacterized repeat protein (TIGR03803 family)